MCCQHICEAGTRKGGEQSIWEHTFSCLSQRHAALLLCANTNDNDSNPEGGDDEPAWRRRQRAVCPQEDVKRTVPLPSPPPPPPTHPDATVSAAVFDDGRFADPPSGKCDNYCTSVVSCTYLGHLLSVKSLNLFTLVHFKVPLNWQGSPWQCFG